jgi:hypothetical protein
MLSAFRVIIFILFSSSYVSVRLPPYQLHIGGMYVLASYDVADHTLVFGEMG